MLELPNRCRPTTGCGGLMRLISIAGNNEVIDAVEETNEKE